MSSRREFLARTLKGGAAVAATTLPAAAGCVRWIDPAPVVDVPPPVNGKLALDVTTVPALAPLGSAVTLRAQGLPPLLLARWPDGQFVAMDSTCTHAGCPLGFADGAVECPCHGARFGPQGEVLRAPARQGLRSYPVTLEVNRVIIDLWAGSEGFPPVNAGVVYLPFTQFPELMTPGGAAAGTPRGLGRPLVVVALPDGAFAALDATCSHLACTVEYARDAQELRCPCHGSTFTLAGAATRPPATLPLVTYQATRDASGVTVHVG